MAGIIHLPPEGDEIPLTTKGDLLAFSTEAIRLGVGTDGKYLKADSSKASGRGWDTPVGSGDVTSAANITDNAIVRGHGGAKGVQDSGVIIDDSDNVTGINDLTTSGNIAVGGALEVDGNLTFPDPGSSANSKSIILIADNATTPQSGTIQTIYGANPYMRLSPPNSGGTATATVDLRSDKILMSTDNTVDLGATGAGRIKDIYIAGIIKEAEWNGTDIAVGYIDGSSGTNTQVLTSDGTNASWQDSTGGGISLWNTWTGAARTDDDTISSTTHLALGTVIRYKATAGSYVYGFVESLSTNAHTITGASCTTAYDDVFEYSDIIKVKTINFLIPGAYADTAIATMLETDLLMKDGLRLKSTGYILGLEVANITDDTGASAYPRINLKIGADVVLTANSNAGIEPRTTIADSGTGIDITKYDFTVNDTIELTNDANGTNNDAKNLSAQISYIEV